MPNISSPEEAKQFLLEQLRKQSELESRPLSERHWQLLRRSAQEMEEDDPLFEDDADDFWDGACNLLLKARARYKRSGGNKRDFKAAFKLAIDNDDCLAYIVSDVLAEPRSRAMDQALLLATAIALVGGLLALVLLAPTYSRPTPSWWHSPNIPGITNSSSWFHRYGGWVFITLSVGFAGWYYYKNWRDIFNRPRRPNVTHKE